MLFVKRGDRVEAEAAALTAAAGCPGVVDLAGLDEGVLRTRRVDGCSVAELGPLAPDEVAGLAAAVATALADLHDLGLAHGGLDAGHVLVGVDGQVRLCSLGRGGPPADDVAALGQLVAGLLDGARTGAPSLSGARRPRGAGPGRARARARAGVSRRLGPMLQPPAGPALAALVTEATDPDPARRPTARAFAAAVHQRAPSARVPAPPARRLLPAAGRGPGRTGRPARLKPGAGPARPPGPGGAGWRRRGLARPGAALPRLVLAAGLVGTAALVVLVDRAVSAGARGHGSALGLRPRVPTTAPPTPPTTTATTATTATTTAPPSTGTAPPATRVWPAEPLQYADGVLTVGATRFALGRPDDEVAAGDWACTGRPTVALLRPSTGEVFAFDGWAEVDQGLAGRRLTQVEGATSLRAVDADGDGCDDLAVERSGREPVVLEPGP